MLATSSTGSNAFLVHVFNFYIINFSFGEKIIKLAASESWLYLESTAAATAVSP